MKAKFLTMIMAFLILCGCADNGMSEEDVVFQFIESSVVRGDFKNSLELSTGINEDQLESIYREVTTEDRETYLKVDIHLTSEDDYYLAYLPDYHMLIEIELTSGNERKVNDVLAYHPEIEELEKIWTNHNWGTRTIMLDEESS
ncbi:hypothetical protein [Gracilibacillus timonensis]|uniref:hypothetical protein n=1 Tax=Gracilibacillus timonensis TaxID=1816696 RepID=UPI0008267417|nr:hypothetical protein [Gracilibacillus timonensis]